MRPLEPHYDSIYNTYRNLYDRRAFAHNVLDWYVWRGRNLKSLCSHIRTTWTDFTGVGEKSRMETAMDEDAFSLSKGSFTVSDLQSVIMGFYLMGNVGVFIWNEFRRTVGGRLRESLQMRATRSWRVGIRDKMGALRFLQLWGCSNPTTWFGRRPN